MRVRIRKSTQSTHMVIELGLAYLIATNHHIYLFFSNRPYIIDRKKQIFTMKNMEPQAGNEPASPDFRSVALPLSYHGTHKSHC